MSDDHAATRQPALTHPILATLIGQAWIPGAETSRAAVAPAIATRLLPLVEPWLAGSNDLVDAAKRLRAYAEEEANRALEREHAVRLELNDALARIEALSEAGEKVVAEHDAQLGAVRGHVDELRHTLGLVRLHLGVDGSETAQLLDTIDGLYRRLATLEAGQSRVQELEAEVGRLEARISAEMDGNLDLRRRFGARDDEGFPGFVERLHREAAEARRWREHATKDLYAAMHDSGWQCGPALVLAREDHDAMVALACRRIRNPSTSSHDEAIEIERNRAMRAESEAAEQRSAHENRFEEVCDMRRRYGSQESEIQKLRTELAGRDVVLNGISLAIGAGQPIPAHELPEAVAFSIGAAETSRSKMIDDLQHACDRLRSRIGEFESLPAWVRPGTPVWFYPVYKPVVNKAIRYAATIRTMPRVFGTMLTVALRDVDPAYNINHRGPGHPDPVTVAIEQLDPREPDAGDALSSLHEAMAKVGDILPEELPGKIVELQARIREAESERNGALRAASWFETHQQSSATHAAALEVENDQLRSQLAEMEADPDPFAKQAIRNDHAKEVAALRSQLAAAEGRANQAEAELASERCGCPLGLTPSQCPETDDRDPVAACQCPCHRLTPPPAAKPEGEKCAAYVPDSAEGHPDCGNCGEPHPEADIDAWIAAHSQPEEPPAWVKPDALVWYHPVIGCEPRYAAVVDEHPRTMGGDMVVNLSDVRGYDRTRIVAASVEALEPRPEIIENAERDQVDMVVVDDPAAALAILDPEQPPAPATREDEVVEGLARYLWATANSCDESQWPEDGDAEDMAIFYGQARDDLPRLRALLAPADLEPLTAERLRPAIAYAIENVYPVHFEPPSTAEDLDEIAKAMLYKLTGTGVPAQSDPALRGPRESLEAEIAHWKAKARQAQEYREALDKDLTQFHERLAAIIDPEGRLASPPLSRDRIVEQVARLKRAGEALERRNAELLDRIGKASRALDGGAA